MAQKVIFGNLKSEFDETNCLKLSGNKQSRLYVSRNCPGTGKSFSGDWKIAEIDFGWTKSSQKSLNRWKWFYDLSAMWGNQFILIMQVQTRPKSSQPLPQPTPHSNITLLGSCSTTLPGGWALCGSRSLSMCEFVDHCLIPKINTWYTYYLCAYDLYGPVRNSFDAGSILYKCKWERVGPWK